MVEEVALQPFVKLAYNGALGKQHNVRNVTALGALDNSVEVDFSPNYGTDPITAIWKRSVGFDINDSFGNNCKQRYSFIICSAFIGFENYSTRKRNRRQS